MKKGRVGGQANLIVLIITILLVLTAIIIVWNIVYFLLSQKSDQVSLDPFTVKMDLDSQPIIDGNCVNLSIKRGQGVGRLFAISFIFKNDSGTQESYLEKDQSKLPLELERKDFQFCYPFEFNITNVSKVSFIPLFGGGGGGSYNPGIPSGETNVIAYTEGCNQLCSNGQACFNGGCVDAISVTSCREISSPGYYLLNNNISSNTTCFNISSDNVVLDGNGKHFNYRNTSSARGAGIIINGQNYVTIRNFNIYEEYAGSMAGSSIYLANSNYSTIEKNHIFTRGYYSKAIDLDKNLFFNKILLNDIVTEGPSSIGIYSMSINFNSNQIYLNTINTSGTSSDGIRLWKSFNLEMYSNIINTFGDSSIGVFLSGSNLSKIQLNSISTMGDAAQSIWLTDCSNLDLRSNVIISRSDAIHSWISKNISIGSNSISTFGSNSRGLLLDGTSDSILKKNILNISDSEVIFLKIYQGIGSPSGTYFPTNNIIENNVIISKNPSYEDLDFSNYSFFSFPVPNVGMNRTKFVDQAFEKYNIDFFNGSLIFKNSNYGEINFISSINGNGTNLSNDIQIAQNSVFVNSTVTSGGLNKNANVTIYNTGVSSGTTIFDKNNVQCISPTCTNFVNLGSGSYSFNINNWTNSPYRIAV